MREATKTVAETVWGWSARFAAVAVVCASLPACGGFGKALGLEKSSPDEFAVVTKAPLVIPPDFALRPPRPGAPRPQELQPSEAAAQALFSEYQSTTVTTASTGEMALLRKAGALESSSSIRLVLNQEAEKQVERRDRSFFDTLLFWRDDEPEAIPGDAAEPAPSQEAALQESVTQGTADGGAGFQEGERKGWF